MTKWARMRRRKERRRAEEALQSQPEGKEPEPIQPEKISKNTQETEQLKHDKSDAKSVVNEFDFSKSNTILAHLASQNIRTPLMQQIQNDPQRYHETNSISQHSSHSGSSYA